MSQTSSSNQKSKIIWASQSNLYEENALAIKMANQAFVKNSQINLQNTFSQRESRIIKKSIKLTEMAKKAQPLSQSQKKYSNVGQLILNEFKIDEQKYAKYDSASQHSSQEETQVKVTKDEVQDMVVAVTKQPQIGKITFISKLIRSENSKYFFRVVKIKGIGNNLPQVHQIKTMGNFSLYEIQTNSFLKKIVIELVLNDKTVAKSRQISFSPRHILLDLQLSYNLQRKAPLKINLLEGLLASCVLEGDRLADQIIQLNGKKQFKTKLLNQKNKLNLDQQTKNLIKENKNTISLLKLLKLLIEEDHFQFGKQSKIINNQSYLILVQLFIQQMLKFKPTSGRQDRQELNITESIRLGELFIHFLCLIQLKIKGLSIAGIQKQVYQKLDEFINFSFQSSQVRIYHQFIKLCIENQLKILPQSYDTIKEYVINYSLNSSQLILTHLQNIYYHVNVKKNKNKPVELFIDIFQDKKFQNNNIYQKQLPIILHFSHLLFEQFQINSLTIKDFTRLFKTYWNFKENNNLASIVRLPSLKDKIQNYMKQLKNKLEYLQNQKQKMAGVSLIQLYFITSKDDQLIQNQQQFKTLIAFLIEKIKDQKDQNYVELVIKLYFQIFKRGQRVFPLDFVKSITNNFSYSLSRLTSDKSLSLINKYFSQDYLQSEDLAIIFNDTLLKPIIIKIIPEIINATWLQSKKNEPSSWHHNFRYQNHINQQILQRMTRVVQRAYGQNNLDKNNYLNTIKRDIINIVEDEDKRNALLCIIQYDMLILDLPSVWTHFTENRSYLKILYKILKKDQEQASNLHDSLKEIRQELVKKQVDFAKIQKIKTMKPNEWHNFVLLTKQYQISSLVDQIFLKGNNYINRLRKLQNFVRELGVTFDSPDYQDLCDQLQILNKKFIQDTIKQQNLPDVFKQFNDQILNCYKLKPFFSQNVQKKPINDIISLCNKFLLKLLQKVEQLYNNYQNDSITTNNFYYFQPNKKQIKQFRNILTLTKRDNIGKSLQDIVNIYSIVADTQEHFKLFEALVKIQKQRFGIQSQEINQYLAICTEIQQKKSIKVKEIQNKLDLAQTKLKALKLNLKQHKNIFQIFSLLIENHEKIVFFKDIENVLKDIKDQVNQSGGQVTYQQIQQCQTTIQFLRQVYEPQIKVTFSQFISAIFDFINKRQKISKQFNLFQSLSTSFSIINQVKQERANMEDKNRSAVKFIDQFIKKVKFQFSLDNVNKDKVVSNATIYPLGQAKTVEEKQIFMNKEKAIMICYTLDQKQQKQRKKQLINFLQIVKIFQSLKQQQLKLTQWGLRQFQKNTITIQIINSQLNKAKQYIKQRQIQLQQWKNKIKKLYKVNYKCAHLQGKKIKQFYDFIMDSSIEDIPSSFLIINQNLSIHKAIIKNMNTNISGFKYKELQIISQYFQLLKLKLNQKPAQDRQQNFLHYKIMARGEIDFIKGIQQIGSQRIKKLRFQELLICTPQTSRSEIKSFIQRALRDNDSEYIIIGFQNLDRRKQQLMVDQIKNYRAQYGVQNYRLKLCLVGDSQLQLLYKFAVEQLSKSPQKIQNIGKISQAYQNKLRQSCLKIKIVYSAMAGIGKTTFIKNHSKSQYQCTEQYYLPLSGIMAVPAQSVDQNNNSVITNQTQKFLWDRFDQMTNYFKKCQKQKKESCLVIQIYNIEKAVIDTINKFLQNVLFFKTHKYKNNIGSIPKDIPIYIQLQNISLSAFARAPQNFPNMPPQMKTLSFLRQIRSVCGQKIINNILQFKPTDILINNEDKELNYILHHLKLFKKGDINKIAVSPFADYKVQPVTKQEGLQLITEYFFNNFKKGDSPSGYLWTYFRALLLQGSKNFSQSYFLLIQSIEQTDDNVKKVNKTLHEKIKLKQSFRSQFYKIILNNCLQFIQRSVRPGNQNANDAFNNTLYDLPFLIIPNIDGDSFSFIYNNSKNVPDVIKNMIVLQTPTLFGRTANVPIQKLFEEENLAAFEKKPQGKEWIERASQILANISGNRNYRIDQQLGYVVNIDNFFKMCLIVQRMRLNIPIVIMGQAGIGKTALLRHVVNHLFKHKFAVFNINAGLPLQSKKSNSKDKTSQSLETIVEAIKTQYKKIQQQNQALEDKRNLKKLWVFFDEFNTLRQLGFFKEIIIDGRYLGKQQPHIKNVVMMAACNPHRKFELSTQQRQGQHVNEQAQRLAFDVLPAPHSLMQCMWNYGALTQYQYDKYISKMLVKVTFRGDIVSAAILKVHQTIQKHTFTSSVSLRDIDRFRQLYSWFEKNLPRKLKIQPKSILGAYSNIEQRAFILACYFTYILRFDDYIRGILQKQIEDTFSFAKGYLLAAKQTQEQDLCSRLNFNWDDPIAVNNSLKENIYSCFVCINTRLPLLIIGAPGSSKSLSLRILAKNLKEKQQDEYLKNFKRIRQYPLQGSQNTTTQDIKNVFEKAYNDIKPKDRNSMKRDQYKQISVIVFDEIGLAQKSKDNPLKVLHPYLQVSREQDHEERVLSFIGISNSQLDVSKMSRLLVLRRPPSNIQDLIFTAQNIALGFKHGDQVKIKYLVEKLTQTYSKFLSTWKAKRNNYPLFFGLRDFYGLIKIFMSKVIQKEIDINDDDNMIDCAGQSIFQNFHGWPETYKTFKSMFFEEIGANIPVPNPTMKETINSVLTMLDKQSLRYPLVIVDDQESLCFIKWLIEKKYPKKSDYLEGSPFVQNKDYSLKLLGEICRYMQTEHVLILSNLSQGVKTGLYDFFNKSFIVRSSNNNKYLRIRTQQGSLNHMQYLYNTKFNCIYLLLQKDLQFVEPPFLSRFQKYRFSLTQYRQQISINILSKINKFIQKVEQICKNNKMQHFKMNNLFINVNQTALQSLVVASYETGGEQNAYKEALRRLIMNSGQYFFKIYKHYIEPNGDLPQIKQIMQEAVQSKNNGIGERNLIIRFTNDKHYTKKFTDKSIISAEFVTFKKEADFDEELSKFFKSKSKKTLYISLNVFTQSIYLNYVTSQIQKASKRALAQNEQIEQKKIRLLYIFDKERVDPKEQKKQKQIAITHFTQYKQQFDDGRLDQMKNISKKQLFNNVIKIDSLFAYVHKVFDFSFENEQNSIKSQSIFTKLAHNLYMKKDGLLSKQAEDITIFLQPNLQMGEQVIKQMLLDKQITRLYKNYREALTKYFADRKLLGALAVFLMYLFKNQSFMSYGSQEILQYYQEIGCCKFDNSLETLIIQTKNKANNNYHTLVNQIIENKKQFIANQYRTLKMTKRLPTAQKKFAVKIARPRLIPFSKQQCQMILNYNDKEIGWYIKQIYIINEKEEKQRFENAYKVYQEQFKKKTRFVSKKNVNLYSLIINDDKNLKTMLFLDLLSDFCEQKGLALKHLSTYYQIVSLFFAGEVNQKKNNKNNEKTEKSITFIKMSSILIGFQEVWIQLFKIWQNIRQQGINFQPQQQKLGTKQNLKKYLISFYKHLENLMLGANILTTFKNPQRYNATYINILFHLEKIEQIMDIPISDKLKSTRTTLVFIQMFDPNKKAYLIKSFMSFKSKISNASYYYDTLYFFEGLKQDANKQQKDKITQFQANQLFYQWFKLQPNSKDCLTEFMQKCNDQIFAHNSVATINLFLTNSFNNFSKIEDCFNKYRVGTQQYLSPHLFKLGQNAKQKHFKNNLAILITNIFIQKLSISLKDQSFIRQQDQTFTNILDKIINSQLNGISTLFAHAYFKLYLKEYIMKLCERHISVQMSRIDQKLSAQNNVSKNLRFYCLKLLRTKYPIKQIKDQYIKKKRVKWIQSLSDIFHEEQSRSISVPTVNKLPDGQNVKEIINKIIQSQGGQVDLFDSLFDQANSPYNRYTILNFFMRYYFSMSYNEKNYKDKVIQKLNASRATYSEKIGKIQFQLIFRYAQSKFDDNFKIESAGDFKEDTFVFFNSINWLLASRTSISPFHSYFFKNNQFHIDFKAAFQGLFFPCGPENDYIGIAQGVFELTRNNNIGVYICSSQCDYIYCHADCGWPNQSATCPMCNKPIGCQPGKGHSIARTNEGARRLISSKLIDRVGNFYVWSMTKLTNYWQMQRNYIQAQINRMKKLSVVKIGERTVKLTGFQMQNNGRVSTLSYNVFRQNISSIIYCLLGLGVINQEQSKAVFQGKNINQAQTYFLQEHQQNVDYIKKALNLDAKIYGWFFGIHKTFYQTLIQFKQQFTKHIISLKEYSDDIAKKLQLDLHEKKVHADYTELFRDMATTLRAGLITKQIENTFDMTAANRFTRDFLESKTEAYIKAYTTMDKFTLSAENAQLQGKMQFPKDQLLTEDQLNEGLFELSRIFKIPDKQIKYNEIVINFELNIRENYPFLDYILKNSESITDMFDFYNVVVFSNELAKEVENNYERTDANRSIQSFTKELWVKKQEKLHQILRNPKLAIDSWNKLSKKMDVLQTQCVIVGRMDNYTLQTPIKAFLIQIITKENLFGLTVTSLVHNFAKMHNELVSILNARKNQISQYKCLNLYNEQKKIHPQKIQQNDVFMITEKQLIQKLYQNSISSINYGKNFVFNNFDTYQHYFVMKLLGKCEIISDIKKFKNICYNGQAFAQTSQSSNTLTEVRQYFYEQLSRQDIHEVQGFIRSRGDKGKIEQYVVKLRGQLEKIMIAIRNLNGIIQAKNLGDFINTLNIDEITYQLKSDTFGRFQISKIVHFYQILELQLKASVIDKLPERYKQIMNQATESQIRALLDNLPLEDQYSVTLSQFGYALYRFIARILLGGVQQNDKILMQFLPYRNDFWSKDFQQYKLQMLMNDQTMKNITFAYAGQLFEIVQALIKRKLGASKI